MMSYWPIRMFTSLPFVIYSVYWPFVLYNVFFIGTIKSIYDYFVDGPTLTC